MVSFVLSMFPYEVISTERVAPLGRIMTVVSGRSRTGGTRYVRAGHGEDTHVVRAPS